MITNHNTNDRPLPTYYVDEEWHSFSMGQMGHGDHSMNVEYYRDFFDKHPVVPFVESEAMYTGLNTLEHNGRREVDAQTTLNAACRAIQTGCCGYGLGVQGVWNAAWDFKELCDEIYIFWGKQDWRTGIDLPIGDYMTNFRGFYEALPWQELEPRKNIITFYNDKTPNDVSMPNAIRSNDAFMPNASALKDCSLIVIYMPDNIPPWIRFLISGLSVGDSYSMQKYNLITDEYIDLASITVSQEGTVILPEVVEVTNVQGWLITLKIMI